MSDGETVYVRTPEELAELLGLTPEQAREAAEEARRLAEAEIRRRP